ncbi:MAG TPA: 16S rRNA (guanine(527)-N(7))-methyltransferase RsmG [Candidatus Binatia bacterium]|nr:16S rRNA (guanine(527)-N(7))-methyltransferase RsmG [Candidatus Binatia bacterium]
MGRSPDRSHAEPVPDATDHGVARGKAPPGAQTERAADLEREDAALLADGARALGISLDESAIRTTLSYVRELRTWARRVDLISTRDLDDVIARHVVDSLAAAPPLRALGAGLSIADLGSGAGLPGIPLAIALRPDRMLLVESRRRRAHFLSAVARALPDVPLVVRNERIEVLPSTLDHTFDGVVTRAAFAREAFLNVAARLLRSGGLAIAFLGPRQVRSSGDAGVTPLGFTRVQSIAYRLPGRRHELHLAVWQHGERCFT